MIKTWLGLTKICRIVSILLNIVEENKQEHLGFEWSVLWE